MSGLLNGLKLWLSCEISTVSNVFNSVSIKSGWREVDKWEVKSSANLQNVGASLLNVIRPEHFEKMPFDPFSPYSIQLDTKGYRLFLRTEAIRLSLKSVNNVAFT